MSRNVAVLGGLPLQRLTTTIRPTATPSNRFRFAALLSTPTRSVARPRIPTLVARVHLSGYNTFRNAATEDSRLSRPRWPASIVSRLESRRIRHVNPPRSRHSEPSTRAPLHRWMIQRRLFSDKRLAENETQVESTGKASEHSRSARENAQRTQDHASTGAGSKTILDRLPHLHRPTKEELLAAATGFWHRMSIRFKWFSIRSYRPFNLDEIGAFASWIFLGHVIWIVIGTTTFVSLAIWFVNTVFAQETLAGWVGNYLTKSSGIKVVFENAIVPTWRNGVITFHNVFVSRRPGQQSKRERAVSKGSSSTAAAAAVAAMAGKTNESADPEDDGNYTQFDVTIDSVNVTLSFSKWFNGKGLLRDVEILGVRGVIDRTSVRPAQEYVDPKSYRHEHSLGDFEIDDFKMADVLLTIHQPATFRPFTVSVFNCSLPRLRKQWLFYDFMSANNMSGSFDDSLFTVHPRQVHGQTGAQLLANGLEDGKDGQWKKHSRLRIDGLNIDHLNRGVEGPFSWIHEGSVDIVADVMIPNDDDPVWRQTWRKSAEAVSEFYDKMEATVTNAQAGNRMQQERTQPASTIQNTSNQPSPLTPTVQPHNEQTEADRRLLVLDINIHLNSVRASVPLFTKDLSYVNNALVRPIVAYINSHRAGAFIPVHCRVIKRQAEFDGSWTIFDSGLLEDVSRETYEAFARDVVDGSARKRRIKKVGLWTIQLAAQALFIGLAGQLA